MSEEKNDIIRSRRALIRLLPVVFILALIVLQAYYLPSSDTTGYVYAGENTVSTVSMEGVMSRADENGQLFKSSLSDVYLVAMTGYQKYSAKTNDKGDFFFSNVDPREDYVLIGFSNYSYMGTEKKTIMQHVGPNQSPTPTTIDVAVPKSLNISWHLRIKLSSPGRYKLDLSRENADEGYCLQIEPKYDPITHEPYDYIKEATPVKIE